MQINTNWIGEKLLEINVEAFCTNLSEPITSKEEAEWLIRDLESVIDDLKTYAEEQDK